MSSTSMFKFVLISGLLFSMAGFVASFSLSETLPLILQDYLSQAQYEELSPAQAVLCMLLLANVLFYPILAAGLWFFKSWARKFYVVTSIGFVPFLPILGPIVMSGWEYMIYSTSLTLHGILLAMMFTGDVSKNFGQTKALVKE
ncbi:hypothetical protein ABMX64_22615 [Vibrio vulnificus]|uniref:hypothetical protein n=1 Tax=Vibrio vulnificus TaxID=672 RepID=UPI000CD03E9E|nr:hypothetical protein [Vibrio vulnificus]EGQ7854817.1 hypothetical protein [Vibrio vulnificus]EHH0804776.1 hypothetical protein [Vibrio vulnificus]EIX4889905.1 hypothetical protein [Vibrio vulnificus]EIZ1412242.1 hypothetical protein [Vibrio vulnificus]EJA3296748.1 hypothetical protein [Vibrio vulnificus]